MSRRVIVLPRARDDFADLAEWIAQDSPAAARAFAEAIEATVRQISEQPGMGVPCSAIHERLSGLRRRPVHGFPNHLIFYIYDDAAVRIIRALHGARNLPVHLLELPRDP